MSETSRIVERERERERGGGCNIRGAATYGETGNACDRVPRQEVWMRNREKGLPDNCNDSTGYV